MAAESDKSDLYSHSPSIAWGWLTLALSPLLVRLLLTVFDTNLWGLNALAFSSNWIALTLAALTLFLLVFVLFKRNHSNGAVSGIATHLPSATGKITAPLLAVLFGAISFFLGSYSHLFGDSYSLIGALSQLEKLNVHPFAFLATKTVMASYQLLNGVTDRALNDSAIALQTLSAASGAFSIWAWLRISAKLARNKREELFLFTAAVFTGSTLLFFGSGEFYGPAVVIVSLIALSFVTMIKAETSGARYRAAGALVFLTILAPFYLAQLIFVLPATVFMLGLGLAPGPKRERIWGILSLVTLVAIVAALYWQAQSDLWIQARIVGLSGKPPEFDYSLFSIRRLFDMFNTSFILWPLFPLTLWLCLRYVWRERCDHIVGGLALLTLSFAVWTFISDFPNGSAREITTVAMFALPASFLAAYLWVKLFRQAPWFGRTTFAIGIVSALTFSALAPVYIDGEAGVKYLDHDYQQRKDRYLSGLVDFRDHYFFFREYPKADQWEWSFSRKSPAFLDHQSIRLMFSSGKYAETLNRLTLLMSTNPYWATLYSTKAAALQGLGRRRAALKTIDQGLQLTPDNIPMLLARGNILRALKEPDGAEAMYLRALEYNSHDIAVRKDLGLFYIEEGRISDAEKQAYLIFEDNPQSAYSFLLVGLVAFNRQEYDRSRQYLNVTLSRGQRSPESNLARLVLERLSEISPK